MINKKSFLTFAAVLLSISFTATAAQPIYKWKDSQGNIKYTQSKPPRGTEYQTIYQRQSGNQEQEQTQESSDSSSSNSSSSDKGDLQDEIIAKQNKEQERVEKANKEIRAKNCTIAQNNLKSLTTSQRVFTEVDGERRLLTDKERNDKTDAAQENVDKYCK